MALNQGKFDEQKNEEIRLMRLQKVHQSAKAV